MFFFLAIKICFNFFPKIIKSSDGSLSHALKLKKGHLIYGEVGWELASKHYGIKIIFLKL
jgi:hypothetical protein